MPRFNRSRATLRRHPALLTIVAIVLVAGLGYLRLEAIIRDIIDARADGRIAACNVDRKFALGHNGLVLYLTHVPGRPPPDPALAAAFEKANLVPVRKCDPKSIAAFNNGKGAR